jgi:diguanylate cyclase (GGDEF)-like protein
MGREFSMRILENNIYFDPLTAMPNFFKFIQMDTKNMFGGTGSVMVFDMVKFIDVNKDYGRDTGDLFLKSFAFNLRSVLKEYKDALMFRTQGDEFTIILHNVQYEEAETLAKDIRSEYKRRMKELTFNNADVHTLVLSYSQPIKSINEFYNMIFAESFKKMKSIDSKCSEERLIEGIVGSFTNRIHETLSLLKDAYSLAMTDDISTLPNQRAARLFLKDLMKEDSEEKNEFSVLFIDGDNLKRYNKISYETGNEMIKALSQVIESSIRKNDKIFRWLSGDEFLVVLDKVDFQDGMKLAERIRVSVEEQTSKWLYPITVSIGMASYPEHGTTTKELVEKAEKANIIAKSTGKNKVVKWMNDKDSEKD